MAKIDLIEVALKIAIGIDATPEEKMFFSKLDSDSQNDLFILIRSSDYIDEVRSILTHLINTTTLENKDEVLMKCFNWIDTLKVNEDIKINIKKLIKSC